MQHSIAGQLGKLNMAAHASSKLRAREQALTALRTAIDADKASLQAPG